MAEIVCADMIPLPERGKFQGITAACVTYRLTSHPSAGTLTKSVACGLLHGTIRLCPSRDAFAHSMS